MNGHFFIQSFRAEALSAHLEYCKLALRADIFAYLRENVPQMPSSQAIEASKDADTLLSLLRSGGDESAANSIATLIHFWERKHNNEVSDARIVSSLSKNQDAQ